jgi:hypothetical protein
MVLDQDSAESPGQDGHDDGQAQTAPGQPAAIQNADDEPKPQPLPLPLPQPQPQPVQGPHLEADVRTLPSPIGSKFIDICIVSRRRRLRAWRR